MTNHRNNQRKRAKQSLLQFRREPKAALTAYNTVPTAAGSVTHVTVIAQNDGMADRDGTKIFVEKLDIGINILATATNNTRYILVRDRYNTASTAPAVTDILSAASVSSPFNSNNVLQQKRFSVLYDRTMSFSLNGDLAKAAHLSIPVNQPTYYSGAASTTYQAGAIFLLVITDLGTAPSHDVRIKVVFSDY